MNQKLCTNMEMQLLAIFNSSVFDHKGRTKTRLLLSDSAKLFDPVGWL